MAWRVVVIENPARLRLENDQLSITQEEKTVTLPLDDMAVLMVESQEVTLSAALISGLAEHNTALLVCDRRHLPTFIGLPCAGHSRLSGVHRAQIGLSLPFKKRCWQRVVQSKIANQAACLSLAGSSETERLGALVAQVKSGDSGNVEARAAREHFRLLFGEMFRRGIEDEVNAALNYGYAVFRAVVARALAVHGFLLTQGIHHRGELNPYNLADDFIEPFRPLVDLTVVDLDLSRGFGPEQRRDLACLTGCDLSIDGKSQSALRAAEIMAASFVTACQRKDPTELKLPSLLPPRPHRYE